MKTLFLLFALMALAACQPDQMVGPEGNRKPASVCGVSNPTQDLPWLKKMIDEASKDPDSPYCIVGSVRQGTYQGQTVYLPSINPGPLCCMIACQGGTVYNCAGDVILSCNPQEEAKITDLKVIWRLR